MGFFYVLNYLYCMKIINRLNEALGVPEGILEVAEEIYDKIVKTDFKYNIVEEFEDTRGDRNIISTPFKIGDLTFKKISIIINVIPHPKADEVDYDGMSISSKAEMVGIGKLKNVKKDSLVVIFNFYCPGDEYGDPTISDKKIKSEIKELLVKSKNKFTASVAHELKHGYDTNKTPYENILNRSKYQTSNKFTKFPVYEIKHFYFLSYFISLSETLVRPTEVMSLIRSRQITKKDFLNFIKSNETYKTLNKIRNLTFEMFYNRLLRNVDIVKQSISAFERDLGYDVDITDKSDEEIVDIFLEIVKDLFDDHSMDFIKSLTFNSGEDDLISNFENQMRYLMSMSNKVRKNISGKEYFKSEIENNAKKANLVIRKLAKLYAMAK